MLKIENFEVLGWEHAIRGMRNPMNSWEKSDSVFIDEDGDWYTITGDSGPFKNVDEFSTDDSASSELVQPETYGHAELRSSCKHL